MSSRSETCSVLDFNRRVLLTNAVLVDHNVVAPDVCNEIPVRVLHQKFYGDQSARGIEMNFYFLLALFTLEERTGDLESGLVRWLLA
jgi:hypothetical protein